MTKRRYVVLIAWGPALAKAMKSSGYLRTQTALARRSGVAQSTIGRILRGEVDPQFGSLQRIARALRVPLATLVDLAQVESSNSGQKRSGVDSHSFYTAATQVSCREQIEHALQQALSRLDDWSRTDEALATLRRKDEEAVERLQELAHACETRGDA